MSNTTPSLNENWTFSKFVNAFVNVWPVNKISPTNLEEGASDSENLGFNLSGSDIQNESTEHSNVENGIESEEELRKTVFCKTKYGKNGIIFGGNEH